MNEEMKEVLQLSYESCEKTKMLISSTDDINSQLVHVTECAVAPVINIYVNTDTAFFKEGCSLAYMTNSGKFVINGKVISIDDAALMLEKIAASDDVASIEIAYHLNESLIYSIKLR